MRTLKYCLTATLAAGLFANVFALGADEGDKPGHTIKEIMKLANGKGGLNKKVIFGNATDEERQQLVELYTDLNKNKPPRGSADEWKERTEAILKAAKDVQAGKGGATAELQKATACKGCHDAHRPRKGAN